MPASSIIEVHLSDSLTVTGRYAVDYIIHRVNMYDVEESLSDRVTREQTALSQRMIL